MYYLQLSHNFSNSFEFLFYSIKKLNLDFRFRYSHSIFFILFRIKVFPKIISSVFPASSFHCLCQPWSGLVSPLVRG